MDNNTPKASVDPVTPPDTTPTATAPSPAGVRASPEKVARVATASTTQPPQPRPRTRRERFADNPPVFRLSKVGADQRDRQEPPPAEDAIRVEYAIKIHGGQEIIVNIHSTFDLPLALREECLAKTDTDFAEILDKVVFAPLLTQVRAHLQGRFDHYAEMKAKQNAPPEAQLPSHHNGAYKSPKPGNGTPHEMPEIDCRPPLPRRPGSAVWPATNNGG